MSIQGSEEGKLLKRKDFLGVDEEARTHPNRTYYYRKSSDLQKIIETCTRKLEEDSRNAKALFLRGNALLKLRDYENAISDISAYLSVDAENEAALYSRGIAWSKIGQPDKAIADMSRVLQLNPNHVNAAFARAACYNAIGQFTKAIEDYNFALLKDEAGGGMRSSGAAYSMDRSGAGTPMGIEVTHSFGHDDSRSPLPWMTSPLSRNRSRQDMIGLEGPVNINSTMGSAANSTAPSPVPHGYESESSMSLSHRLSAAIRPHPATPTRSGHEDIAVGNNNNTNGPASFNSRSRTNSESSGPTGFDQRGSSSQTTASITNAASPEKKEIAEREYALGYQCRKQGDFRKAVVHYTNAIEANPNSFKAVFNRGFAYDKLEDFDRAIRDYSVAATIEPDNAFAYYNRGITHDRSGDLDASCNDFAKAISIQPNNVDFIHNYGNCLRKFEKYEEAAAVYLKAIQLLPKGTSFKAHFNRGVCLEKLERMNNALGEYNEALSQQPKHTQSMINRANVFCALGKLDACMSDLESVGQNSNLSVKQQTSIAAIRANVLEKKGNLPEALVEIERALALEGSLRHQQGAESTLLLSTRANIYKSMEDYNKAISDLTQALKLNPPNPSTCHSIRGLCWRKLGNFEEALSDYGKCIEHHMTMYNAMSNVDSNATLETRQLGARHYNNRAYCYAKLGRYREAIGDYSAAIQLDPMNSHAYHNRGTSYDKIGQGDLAIADFTKVLELDTADGQTVTSANSGPSQIDTGSVRRGGPGSTPATDVQNSHRHNMTRSPSHAAKNPISPDRSVSTIGDSSVGGAAAAYHVTATNNARYPGQVSANGHHTGTGEHGALQSRRDAPRAYGTSPLGNIDQSGYTPGHHDMNESSIRDNGVARRRPSAGRDHFQESAAQSMPQSRYQNWNAARVNTALESAAQLAAAPIDNNIRIRSASPNSIHRDQPTPHARPMTQQGVRNVHATPLSAQGQRRTGADRRPGSAPPLRPGNYQNNSVGVNSIQRLGTRAPSPTPGPKESAWRQNLNVNANGSGTGTGIAIGGGSYGDSRGYVSTASHSPINSQSQQRIVRPSPAPNVDQTNVAGRTSPMRTTGTRNARLQPANSRSQSPRIPLRVPPPNLGQRDDSPTARASSVHSQQHEGHNRTNNSDRHIGTGDSNYTIQPPVVARGRFSNYNR